MYRYHNDGSLMSPVAGAGLLAVLFACLYIKNTIHDKSHYILYNLVAAIQLRMLVTFNEGVSPFPVSVDVGQAVNVVGYAGNLKTITSYQILIKTVFLAHGERSDLATEKYVSPTPVMEGHVILRKYLDYRSDSKLDLNRLVPTALVAMLWHVAGMFCVIVVTRGACSPDWSVKWLTILSCSQRILVTLSAATCQNTNFPCYFILHVSMNVIIAILVCLFVYIYLYIYINVWE